MTIEITYPERPSDKKIIQAIKYREEKYSKIYDRHTLDVKNIDYWKKEYTLTIHFVKE